MAPPRVQRDPERRAHVQVLHRTLAIIGEKWSLEIIAALADGPRRFTAVSSAAGAISAKILTNRLKTLEQQGLLTRTHYGEIPPHVEYDLTETGRTLLPIIEAIAAWGKTHVT